MANIVLKLTESEQKVVDRQYIYRDIDAFTDKYAVNKVDSLKDVEAVKAAVRNLFIWNYGERVLFPEYGSRIREILFRQHTSSTEEDLVAEIHRLFDENEPRAKLEKVYIDNTNSDNENNTIRLAVAYSVTAEKQKITVTDTINIDRKRSGLPEMK